MITKTYVSDLEKRILTSAKKHFDDVYRSDTDKVSTRLYNVEGIRLFNPRFIRWSDKDQSIDIDKNNIRTSSYAVGEVDRRSFVSAIFNGEYFLTPEPGVNQRSPQMHLLYTEKIDGEKQLRTMGSIDGSHSDLVIQSDYSSITGDVYSTNGGGDVLESTSKSKIELYDVSIVLPEEHSEALTATGAGDIERGPILEGYSTMLRRPHSFNRDVDMFGKKNHHMN